MAKSPRTAVEPDHGQRPVFSRVGEDAHPYDAALNACATSGEPLHAAMAQNIRYDHRVSERREQRFDGLGHQPRSFDALQQACVDYFEEQIRWRSDPDSLGEPWNAQNILVGGVENHRRIKAEARLGRILDLNGLLHPLKVAAEAGIAPFSDAIRALNSEAQLGRYLDSQLANTSLAQREAFLASVFHALGCAKQRPFQPTWVTAWDDLEPVLDQGPERWLEIMGVAKATGERWLIVLKYSVEDAGTLVRPTILDTNWQGRHFPSPPPADLCLGGHPVDLAGAASTMIVGRLAREYIHCEVTPRLEDWISAGRQIKRTISPSPGGILTQRQRHHLRLLAVYGESIRDWMPSP